MSLERAVYLPRPAEGFEFCYPARQEDFETLCSLINGTARAEGWRSPPMRLVHEDRGRVLAESDSPWLGSHALIFRPVAVGAMDPVLRSCGELLPLQCPEADLVVFNPTEVVDALDEAAAEVQRFSSGKIMRITRYAFRADVVAGLDAFKIPNLRVSPTFVSERFREKWVGAELEGLDFERIW